MQNISAASRLLGRGSASGAGDVEELTISTGLSLSGTALSATFSGSLASGQIAFGSSANVISSEGAFTYNSTLNLVVLAGLANGVTTMGGGEIQLDDVVNGDELLLRTTDIMFTDGPTGDTLTIIYSSGFKVQAAGGIALGITSDNALNLSASSSVSITGTGSVDIESTSSNVSIVSTCWIGCYICCGIYYRS